jgi:hypothetical protein
MEERYRSIGPLGRLFEDRCYPRDTRPGPNSDAPPVPAEQQYRRPEAPSAVENEAEPEPIHRPAPQPR